MPSVYLPTEISGLNYQSLEFFPEQAHKYSFRLLITPSGIQTMISDDRKKKLLKINSHEAGIKSNSRQDYDYVGPFLDQLDYVQFPWKEIRIALSTSEYTLVPETIYHDSIKNDLLKLNASVDEHSIILSDLVSDGEMRLVYSISDHLLEILTNFFSGQEIIHATGALINRLRNFRNNDPTAYVHIQQELMQVFIFNNGKLQLSNQFNYYTKEDFLFYLLVVLRKTKLSPETVQVKLLGEIAADSALFNAAFKYIRNVDFIGAPHSLTIDEDYPLPRHYFFNLFCI